MLFLKQMLNPALAFLAASFATFVLTPAVKKIAVKIGAVDKPNSRKVHKGNIPRLGGVAIYAGFILSLLLFRENISNDNPVMYMKYTGLIVGSTVIVILGVFDDIFDINPKIKLLGQIIAAACVIPFGIKIELVTNPFASELPLHDFIIFPATIIWIVAITNAVNLIDGLDGLAAGVSTMAALTLAAVALVSDRSVATILVALALAGSGIGFLRYNFHPAKIFMGDSGSMLLGFNLATLAIMGYLKSTAFISLVVPILILGIPVLDTSFAILRRFINGQPIFKSDKEHLHHKLLAVGLSHKNTVLVIYLVSFIFGIIAFVLTQISTAQAIVIITALATTIVIVADQIGLLERKSSPKAGQWMEQSPEQITKDI